VPAVTPTPARPPGQKQHNTGEPQPKDCPRRQQATQRQLFEIVGQMICAGRLDCRGERVSNLKAEFTWRP
jgi:hypothetical protein